jgi:uncharacterized delta-60 repeat protein
LPRRLAALVLVLVPALGAAASAHAGPVALDPSFSANGWLRLPVAQGTGNDSAYGVAVQPNGKVVEVGVADNPGRIDAQVVRFNRDGTLDRTFDGDSGAGNGVVTTRAPHTTIEMGLDVALQPDGKIVVAGRQEAPDQPGGGFGGDDFLALRYLPDGRLDRGFGHGGRVAIQFGHFANSAQALALQPDGKIVLAGEGRGYVALARLNTDGSLDQGFGGYSGDGKGKVVLDQSGVERVEAVAVTPAGRILAGGMSTGGTLALVRLLDDGKLDPSFDGDNGKGNGVVAAGTSIGNETFTSIALRPDGRIVAAGTAVGQRYHAVVARFLSDGRVDQGFGDRGVVYPGPGTHDVVNGVVALPGGKVVAAGATAAGDPSDFALFALTAGGQPDAAVAPGGVFRTRIAAGDYDTIQDAALAPDGRLVAAGSAGGGATWDDVTVARYLIGPAIDGSADLGTLEPGPRGKLKLRGLHVLCPAACAGKAELSLGRSDPIHTTATFNAPRGASTVTVKLPDAALDRLKRNGGMRGSAKLTVSMRDARPAARTVAFKLRPPEAR